MITSLAEISFLIGGFFYFIALLFLLYFHKKSQRKNLFALAISSIIFCSLITMVFLHYKLDICYLIILETIRNFFCLSLLLNLYSSITDISNKFKGNHKSFILFIAAVLFMECCIYYLNQKVIFLSIFHLLQSIFILFIIEQLFRKTIYIYNDQFKLRPLCISLGLINTYDFAFYADSLLTQQIDKDIFFSKGWLVILSSTFIIQAIKRMKNWSKRIRVSRGLVFNSTLFILFGFYLLLMSCIAYFINHLNYGWNNTIQNIFISLSFILFACFLYSDLLRQKINKFIIKNLYESKYDYNEQLSNFSDILETNNNNYYQIALSSIMNPFNCQQGAMFEINRIQLIEKANQFNQKIAHLDVLTDLSKKSIQYNWIIDVDELKNPRVRFPFSYEKESILSLNQVRYIIPITGIGKIKFVIMLSNIKHIEKFDFEDRNLLNMLCKHLSIFLNLHITNDILIENQQFVAFNQMSTFLVHDLKNILAQLSLLSKNSEKFRDNPDFIDDTFITIDSAAMRLSKVLCHFSKHNIQEYKHQKINICDVTARAVQERISFKPAPTFDKNFIQPLYVQADQEKLTNILINLIRNAQEACKENGTVAISLIDKHDQIAILIEDDGEGMTMDFITHRLFKPFDTTKGNAGLGVGAYDAKKFIEQLNGSIDVSSVPEKGSKFEICLPISSNG